MLNKNHRLIVISDENWEILRNAGTITDSFNTAITRLIKTGKLNNENKVAVSGEPLARDNQTAATTPQSTVGAERGK